MSSQVTIDRQGRIVIPLRERERLGLTSGGVLDLIATPEGTLLERHNHAEVRQLESGLRVVSIEGVGVISNEETLEAIRRLRDRE